MIIRSIAPAVGDWYVVQCHHETAKPDRWFIDRIAAWVIVIPFSGPDTVLAVGADGIVTVDTSTDVYFVCGADRSPVGTTWRELHDTPTIPLSPREFTEAMKDWRGTTEDDDVDLETV